MAGAPPADPRPPSRDLMAAWLMAAAGRLLPPAWRDWPRAMAAELEEIPPGTARRRFIRGCVGAILIKAIELRIRGWLAQPAGLLLALAAGVLIALLDRVSGSRTPMWLTLLAGSALLGWCRPASAWRWGILLAAGIPLLAAADPGGGPYARDRADARYGLLPAVALATIAGFCRRRSGAACLPLVFLAPGQVLVPDSATAQATVPRPELTSADLSRFADSIFAEYLRLAPDPCLALVVVKDDSILFARGYGSEDLSGSRPVDPEGTVFWLGSLSKLITADAVMREIDRGRLSLETAANDHLEWLPSRAGWRKITVRDLLTHTSGIDEPFMAGTADRPDELVSLARYLERVRWRAGGAPGRVLRYSNHGMALAGLLVERVSGTAFEEYAEREIFGPLEMRHSSFRQPLDPELSRRLAAAGTDARVDFLLPAPAGAMVGTAADMGRFLIGQLDTGGPHAASLRVMHATHWRGHPEVPGIALGWFETRLGGVNGLFHTGARHHFSVAWVVPARRIGVFLVHSMRQGGRFRHLRTTVIRTFARRYLPPDSIPVLPDSSAAVAGVYRPMLLSTTTVERLGYLALDARVRVSVDGSVTLHAPGELGTVWGEPAGGSVFEVRNGPHAGLRIGFVTGNGPGRIAIGGTLLDPVTLIRLSWWERGLLHAVALGGAALVLTLAGVGYGIGALRRRRHGRRTGPGEPWPLVTAAGAGFALALAAFITVVLTTPEIGAAAHMRSGLRIVLVLLSAAWACCLAIPVAMVLRWRRGLSRIAWSLLSLSALLAAGLLWHYRLIGFRL